MITTILSDFSYVLATPQEENWEINQKLLDYYFELKSKQITVAIYSASEVVSQIDIKNKLGTIRTFSSKELNLSKTDPESYRKITKTLGKKPEEVVFVDDRLANIEAAREAGLQIVYHTSTEDTIKKLQALVGK